MLDIATITRKIQRNFNVFITSRVHELYFILAFAFVAILAIPIPSIANPENGVVVEGSVKIVVTSPTRLDVYQETDRIAVDWSSFSISIDEQTFFHQPSPDSIALNRIIGGDIFLIDGYLSATGRLFIVNPHGVAFGPSSLVDVAGLVATTANIGNADFMAGRFDFDVPSSDGAALVTNHGELRVMDGGLIALVAPGVENSGAVYARLGKVSMASARTFTLDLYGDELVQLAIDGQTAQQIAQTGGDQGLTAELNMSGVIQAQTALNDSGEIILRSGEHGTVIVAGTLDASGRDPGQTGGTVKVLGDKVGLFERSVIDVAGDVVGGNFQGRGPEPNAQHVFIGDEVAIMADAVTTGDGGQVIVWSDKTTRFYGDIDVSAGTEGGNGGFVEVSGKESLWFAGSVDLSAPHGAGGDLLLDPRNLTIQNGGAGDLAGVNGNDGNPQVYAFAEDEDGTDATIDASAVINALAGGNVTLQANDDVTVNEAITSATAGSALTIQAGDDVAVNADISLVNGAFTVTANDGAATPTGAAEGTGDFTMADAVTISTGSGDVTITAEGNVTIEDITSSGNVTLTSTAGSVLRTSVDSLVTGSAVRLDAGSGAGDAVGSAAAAILTTAANIAGGAGTGGFHVTETNAVIVGDGTSGITITGVGDINLTTSGAITDTNPITASGTTTLAAGAGNNITLDVATNDFSTVGITSGNNVALVDANALILAASTVSGTFGVTVSAGVTVNGNVTSVGTMSFDADIDNNGVGDFTVAAAQTLSTTNNALSITANDLIINAGAQINTGSAALAIADSDGSGIGLGATPVAGGLNVTAAELQQLASTGLLMTTAGAVTVNGIGAANSNTVGTLTIVSGGSVAFNTAASTFDTLVVNADDRISVNVAVTTDTGGLTLDGDADNAAGTNDDVVIAAGVTHTSALNITLSATTGGITGIGAVTLNAVAGVTIVDAMTTGGATIINADSNDDGSGTFTLNGSLNGSGQSITITSANVVLAGALSSIGGSVTLEPSTTGRTIGLGNGATGAFTLSAADLAFLSDGFAGITIGRIDSGAVDITTATFTDPVTIRGGAMTLADLQTGADNVVLISSATVLEAATDTAADVTTTGLVDITAAGAIGSAVANGELDLSAGSFQATTSTCGIFVRESAGLTIGSGGVQTTGGNAEVKVTLTTGNLVLDGPVAADGSGDITLTLEAANAAIVTDAVAETISSNSGHISLTADIMTLASGTISSTGLLILQPNTINRSIGIGNGAVGDLNLTDAELGLLVDGFTLITIGRNDGTGAIDYQGFNFLDPVTFGGGTTILGTDLVTNGNPVSFPTAVVLTASITIDSTNGGAVPNGANITFSGTVDATTAGVETMILIAGTGNIKFVGNVGATTRLGMLTVTSAKDVTFQATADVAGFTQTIGTGTTDFGSVTMNSTAAIDVVTGEITGTVNAPGQSVRLIATGSVTGTVVAQTLTVGGISVDLIDTIINGEIEGDAAALVVVDPPIGGGPYIVNSVIFVDLTTVTQEQVDTIVAVTSAVDSQIGVGQSSDGVSAMLDSNSLLNPFAINAFGDLLLTAVPSTETFETPASEPLSAPIREPLGEPGQEPPVGPGLEPLSAPEGGTEQIDPDAPEEEPTQELDEDQEGRPTS